MMNVTPSIPASPASAPVFAGKWFGKQNCPPPPSPPPAGPDRRSTPDQWVYSASSDLIDVIPVVGDVVSWVRTGRLIKKARRQGVDEQYVKKMKRIRWVDVGLTPVGWMIGIPRLEVLLPTNMINEKVLQRGLEDRDAKAQYWQKCPPLPPPSHPPQGR